MTHEARIIIVDDHPLVRAGLKALLAQEHGFRVVGEADGVAQTLELIREDEPDLVILDLALSDGDGLDLIQRLRRHYPALKILVVSMRDERLYAERVLEAGALGFLDKQAATEQIIEAVHATLAGRHYVDADILDRILERFGGKAQGERSIYDSLSNRELEVLSLIGRGHPTGEIARRLHLSVKTIETHRDNIKRKLGLSSAMELTRAAIQFELGLGATQERGAPAGHRHDALPANSDGRRRS